MEAAFSRMSTETKREVNSVWTRLESLVGVVGRKEDVAMKWHLKNFCAVEAVSGVVGGNGAGAFCHKFKRREIKRERKKMIKCAEG